MQKGIQKGKLETTRMMKGRAYPIKDIMIITGLSIEEIEAL